MKNSSHGQIRSFLGFAWHLRFVRRQVTRVWKQATVLVLCVILSVVTLVALGSFKESTNRSIMKDARSLHAADIILRSPYPFDDTLKQALKDLEKQGLIKSAQIHRFYSVVRNAAQDRSLLVDIKAPQSGYPFYGKIILASGRNFQEVLKSGSAIVEKTVLQRLNLQLGDQVKIGQSTLVIADTVEREPDRPVNLFSLGPRVFVPFSDLDKMALVSRGSRVSYRFLVAVTDPDRLDRLAASLEKIAPEEVRVETFQTARSRVKRFFENFLFFLELIGIFTLILGGIGIQSTLAAFLRMEKASMGILKTLGANSRFIVINYTFVVMVLGGVGTVLGLLAGFALQGYLPRLFQGFLPAGVEMAVSWNAVIKGLLMGTAAVALFSFPPLVRLRKLKPNAIFGKETSPGGGDLTFYLTIILAGLLFCGLILWQMEEIRSGLYFLLGTAFLILTASVLAHSAYWILGKIRFSSLAVRQAVKGLFRPANATTSITVTLAAALSVIFSIYFIENNLDKSYIESYPEKSPNLFFLNILPEQMEEFSELLGVETTYYPIVRARVIAVNDERIDPREERKKKGDDFGRSFNLTYRDSLLTGEDIKKGESLFRRDWHGPQVSVLDQVLEMREMDIGDTITFNVQGVPLTAKISSIRSHDRETFSPYFYFVFPEKVLGGAPRTSFTALRVENDAIAELQNRVVSRFPNVSAIDLTSTISLLSELMHKLSKIIRFFSSFSILAGILIIISSFFATRYDRLREAVYFKILGAKNRFVILVFTLENLLIGFVSIFLGLILAHGVSFVVTRYRFDLEHEFMVWTCVAMVAAFSLLIALMGAISSRGIIKHKPVTFLREQE